MRSMLFKPKISFFFFFAVFPAFCSTSESPWNVVAGEMVERIEQKRAKAAKGEGVTESQYVIEFGSCG